MRNGLRPRIMPQIFAPIPAARSRCLSSFIAIARDGLPTVLRYDPSQILFAASLLVVLIGMAITPYVHFGSSMVLFGWITAGLGLFAMLSQGHFDYGHGRPRLIRQLDQARRSEGLDNVLLPESLEFLEEAAQQWERIEHTLASPVWMEQTDLKLRINQAAHFAMEDLVVLECGSRYESGADDDEAERRLSSTSANLRMLADELDAVTSASNTYPREKFDSSGVPANGVVEDLEDLEEILDRMHSARRAVMGTA